MAELKDRRALAVRRVNAGNGNAFCTALKEHFSDPTSGLGKAYLRLLVDEIRLDGNELVVSGSHRRLADAIGFMQKRASALAFHELTDQLPPKVWMAIGPKDWRPQFQYPPVRFARFPETQLSRDVEHYRIDGVPVPIFGIAKTITDLFRYRRTVGINLALEGLREALRKPKTNAGRDRQACRRGGRMEDDGAVFDDSNVQWLSRFGPLAHRCGRGCSHCQKAKTIFLDFFTSIQRASIHSFPNNSRIN